MPKITVEIEWDRPDEPFWLNADNVAVTLHAYCKNTKFVVRDVGTKLALEPSDDEILVFATKKTNHQCDYDSLSQRLPEKVVSEIHQAIGQASTCWEHLAGAGVFDAEKATDIANDLCNFIADFLESGWEETEEMTPQEIHAHIKALHDQVRLLMGTK